jgi:hypothetical protein
MMAIHDAYMRDKSLATARYMAVAKVKYEAVFHGAG